jgi:formate hydrogenlyase transcriptional activator
MFPPCARFSDIPLLVRHFAQQFSKQMNKVIDTIPSATMDALCRYHWPGNIRELQNVIEPAMITSAGPALNVEVADLKLYNSTSGVEKANPPRSTNGSLQAILEETERQQILKALEHYKWVVGGSHGAAAHLQMNRSTLQVRMRKLGIARGSS